MTRLALLLCLAGPALAAEYRVEGVLHGVPVRGEFTLEPRDQTWAVSLWSTVDSLRTRLVDVRIGLRGTYERQADGALVLSSAYAGARFVIESVGAGWRVRERNADFVVQTIAPR